MRLGRRQAGNRTGARPKAVVIGAGPGGLAATMLLAHAGLDVTLLEKDTTVGGRCRTITAPGGWRFDLGPTFFLFPQILREIFAGCGEDFDRAVPMVRLDPLYRIRFEGDTDLEIAAEPERLKAEIAKLAPADALGLAGFMAESRRKLDLFKPVLERPFGRPTDYAAPAMLRALPSMRPHLSVAQDLGRWFKDPRVRLAFSFQTKYLGMSPFRCPSLFTILSYLEHGHGVWHPIGGCGAVSTAMAEAAARQGARIELGRAAERIVFEGGRAVAVEADGRRWDADAVVLNADFTHAAAKLIPEPYRPRWPDRRIDSARLSCSTFMLYLGLEGRLDGLAHHTVLLARDYEANIAQIESGILPPRPSLYVQHAGATDASMAPPGGTALYVLAPVPNLRGPIDWTREAASFRKVVLDRLREIGLPDIEPRIRYERVLTPLDWRDSLAVGEGATFNLAHDLGQMLYFRPHNRLAQGLYLVGGGTHPGSGLPVIYEGARISTRLLLEDMGLPALAPKTTLPSSHEAPSPGSREMAGVA